MEPKDKTIGGRNDTLLVVEDDQTTAELLKLMLGEHGFKPLVCCGFNAAMEVVRDNRGFAAALIDLSLPDGDGVDILREVREARPGLPCFVITASETTSDVVTAMKAGATDYLVKPLDFTKLVDDLNASIAVYRAGTACRIHSPQAGPGVMRWKSPRMRAVVKSAMKAAQADSPVLISGPAGCGRTAMARFIHQSGSRRDKSFMSVNAAVLPPRDLELELFGRLLSETPHPIHAAGGKLERARGNDLFLENIDCLTPSLQAGLAEWLAHTEAPNLAATPRCRLIASTSVDLEAQVQSRSFLSNLWYALSVYQIQLPSLAERPEDIPLLCENIITNLCIRKKLPRPAFTRKAMEMIIDHGWPGNLTELQSVLEHAVTHTSDRLIGPSDLARLLSAASWTGKPVLPGNLFASASIEDITKAAFTAALEACDGNRRRVAKRLKVSLRTVYNMIRRFDIPAAPRRRNPGTGK